MQMQKEYPAESVEEKVVAVLKTCYDPEIPVDIYQLGLIYDVLAPRAPEEPGKVKVIMTLTAPNCPAAQTLPAEAKYKIERLQEVEDAEVEITFDPPWTPEKMSEEARLVLNLV
jgi:FeS assembly SUF system protein